MKKEDGFTLAELLIVVAIVSVLVCLSVPIFSGKKEKAINATNMANSRAAKAACYAENMDNKESLYVDYNSNHGKYTLYYYYYDIETSKVFWPGHPYVDDPKFADIREGAYIKVDSPEIKRNGIYRVISVNVYENKENSQIVVISQPYFKDGKETSVNANDFLD